MRITAHIAKTSRSSHQIRRSPVKEYNYGIALLKILMAFEVIVNHFGSGLSEKVGGGLATSR